MSRVFQFEGQPATPPDQLRRRGRGVDRSVTNTFAWGSLARISTRVWMYSALVIFVLVTGSARAQSPSPTNTSSWVYEGFTEPRYDVLVAATEIGRLAEVNIEVGDAVSARQIVGRLEDDLQQSALTIAQHQSEMDGELNANRATVSMHEARVKSLRALSRDGTARPDELARAETDLQIASGQLLAAQEQRKLRQLELERAKLQLERRRIRIPMDGVISEVFHRSGEYITPGDPAICRLLVIDQLYAVFNIPVEEIAMIKIGTRARVFLRSTARTIDASITTISPTIDGESGTVQVRVLLDNQDRNLRVGDRCTLRLIPNQSTERRPVRSTMRYRGTEGR